MGVDDVDDTHYRKSIENPNTNQELRTTNSKKRQKKGNTKQGDQPQTEQGNDDGRGAAKESTKVGPDNGAGADKNPGKKRRKRLRALELEKQMAAEKGKK